MYAEIAVVEEMAEEYRIRLYDLSWFMRTLNENIARQANAEDGVRGRFWGWLMLLQFIHASMQTLNLVSSTY